MYYMHDSLLPENQEKLVIQVAPYGPEFLPGDCADIPVTMDEQVQKAVDCFNAGDLEGVLDLYAENASAEDPVGTPVHQGKDALRQFYVTAIETKGQLELVAPMRGSQGNCAAMAFDVKLNLPSGPATVRVIDVMSFDEECRITSMRAFWGPDDFISG